MRSGASALRHAAASIGGALALASCALALAGCAMAPPAAGPARPAPVAAAPSPSIGDALATGPVGIFRSKRFDLALPLPDGRGFAIDDTRGPWLVAEHRGSSSTLLVRRWRELGRVGRDGCEESARRGRTLPTLDDAEVLEVRMLAVPPDHDTHATVALYRPTPKPPATSAPLFGMVLAFGAWSRECFAYAFVTQHEGPGAEAIVAERLVRFVDQSLAAIRARSDLDPTLERDAAGPRR